MHPALALRAIELLSLALSFFIVMHVSGAAKVLLLVFYQSKLMNQSNCKIDGKVNTVKMRWDVRIVRHGYLYSAYTSGRQAWVYVCIYVGMIKREYL